MSENTSSNAPAPAGVTVRTTAGGLVVRVRAGTLDLRTMAAALIAAIWGLFWLTELARVLQALGAHTLANPIPEIAVHALFSFIGVYCTALCLWAMLGHERLVIRRGTLRLGSPWLLGLLTRRYDMEKVHSFMTHDKDCSTQHDGCCCHISTVDYALLFDYAGQPVPLFPHLSHEKKDWLRDRLNAALGETHCAAGCACHGHDHGHEHGHSHGA